MRVEPIRRAIAIGGVGVSIGLSGVQALAQEAASPPAVQETATERLVPTNNVVLTGYGTAGYQSHTHRDHDSAFSTVVTPIFLYQFQDRVLFETELEFEVSEGATKTGLEYAQVNFMVNDHLIVAGGRMLLPFGIFSPRVHPTWINLFPSNPPIFGHDVGPFGEPLAPILSDVGVMVRGVAEAGRANLAFNGYVTQGPQLEMGGHGEEGATEEGGQEEAEETPGAFFPAGSEDNNTNKMIGGRFDFLLPPWLEFNVSGLRATLDPANELAYSAVDVAAEVHGRNIDWRTEYVSNWQQVDPLVASSSLRRHGLYSQVAYRTGAWQPVFRYTRQFATKRVDEVVDQAKWQVGIALDYWISPAVALMTGFEVNREAGPELDNDRVVAHLAFGF